MNGFITESVSKLLDGLGTTMKLLAALVASSMLFITMERSGNYRLVFIYLLFLLAAGVYCLYLALVARGHGTDQAFFGMLSGLLFWQAFSHSGKLEVSSLKNFLGLIFILLVLTIMVWKRGLPEGLRFMILLVLANWICQQVLTSTGPHGQIASLIPGINILVRYMAIAGIGISVWFILLRSQTARQRMHGALLLYSFILLSFLPI